MVLIISGLPSPIKYAGIKTLIKQQCNISDFVLDNLKSDQWTGTKRVTVAVTDQREASHLVKCLDGFNMSGNKLQVLFAEKTQMDTNQPQISQQNQSSNMYGNSSATWPSLNLQPPVAVMTKGMYQGQGTPQGYGKQMPKPERSHVLRSVEVVDAPINRGNQRYSDMEYEAQQKPMTIKHDNFQGPMYGVNRSNQGAVPYQSQTQITQPHYEPHGHQGHSLQGYGPSGHGPQGHGQPSYGSQGHGPSSHQPQSHGSQSQMVNQPAHWNQQAQQDRYPKQGPEYDRKYTEPDKPTSKVLLDRSADYNKPYDKPGPRFSPRREKEGPRFSPRREIETRFSPGREKDRYVNQPRFSPRREVDGRFPRDNRRFSPPRDAKDIPGPRFSPRRDKLVSGSRFSPRRDMKDTSGPRFSPRREIKDGPGPRFSPRREIKDVPGPRFSPRRDIKDVSGPRFSPRREIKEVSGPRFSPRREMKDVSGPRFSPRREIKDVPGPRFSPRRDLKGVPGSRFSPRRDVKDVPSARFSPRRDIKGAPGPRFSPKRDMKTGPRFSPRRDMKVTGSRFSPRRELNEGGPRFSPRRDVKVVPGPRFSPKRDIKAVAEPRFSPRRDFDTRGRMPSPGRRISPRRGIPHGGPLIPDKRFGAGDMGRRDSPPRQHQIRYSPSRQFDKDKYTESQRKDVRPAYEPTEQAPNQAMYSGGYRPNVSETIQYPIPGFRPQESVRPTPTWDQVKQYSKKEDVRESRMPKFEPRIDDIKPRTSRSPIRRDRSPLREKFRKHSPSPKSPRRSWALEKRHSPEVRDAPPPPVWPGQSREAEHFRNRGFPEKMEHMIQKQPVWEHPAFEEKPRERIELEDRRFPDKSRVDVPRFQQREPSPHLRAQGFKTDDRFPRNTHLSRESELKFDPKYEDVRRDKPDFRPKDDPVDIRRREISRPEGIVINKPDEFNKEFQDIYKRAIELNKRSKELRKNDETRRFSEEHQREENDYGRKFREADMREPNVGHPRDMRPASPRRDHRDIPRHDLIRPDLPRRQERRDMPQKQISPRRDDRIEPRHVEPRHEDRRPSPRRQDNQQWKSIQTEDSRFKRERAVDEIANKLMDKYGGRLSPDLRPRVHDELKIAVNRIFKDIFGHKEVSFIELVVKFQAQFNDQDETKLFEEVMTHLPGHLRKRVATEGGNAAPAKVPRMIENTGMNQDLHKEMTQDQIADWNKQISQMAISQMGSMFDVTPEMMGAMGVAVNPGNPVMVPNPFGLEQFQKVQQMQQIQQPSVPHIQQDPIPQIQDLLIPQDDNGYNLYLCKDDFDPYTSIQADYLKNFLVAQMIKTTDHVHGWAPDFTIKGLQSMFRYEVTARDDDTKRWILDLDFRQFKFFNVLVYTKEELWYERGAVWLPGHTRSHNLTPFAKLKLQNQKLEGVNIDMWKFVKQVVTVKGTRVYVDMPPSAARALEQHKLSLSYELQKVNVFLKAMAVDKQSFDNGLRETSINDELANEQNIPMPSLGNESNLIKIGLKGEKPLTVDQANKVKEIIVNRIFKYQQSHNMIGRTDFIKYGYCLPGYFGVVPANNESKRWLLNLNIGTLKKHPIVIIGSDEDDKKIIKMIATLNIRPKLMPVQLYEKIKTHNTGVKGLNFNKWKLKRHRIERNSTILWIDMDLDSVESLAQVDYKLDYIEDRKIHVVTIKYDGNRKIGEVIKKIKDESKDSYDVANMDIASDDDDDIVYMGTTN